MISKRQPSSLLRKPPNAFLALSCTALLTLLCAGCATDLTWKYSPAPPLNRSPLFSNTVTVPPFADSRPSEDVDHRSWVFIPLLLYADSYFNRIDATVPEMKDRFNPTEDLAKALATELNNRRFFESVKFASADIDGELVLRGEVTSTRLDTRTYAYGVSALCAYLWLVGLPASTVNNELGITLSLEEPRSQAILWRKSYKVDYGETLWFYEAFSGKTVLAHFYQNMLKGLMPTIVEDMENAMKTIASPPEGKGTG